MTARRHLLILGTGAAAAVAGAGLAALRWRHVPEPHALYQARFAQPAGGELALAEFLGRPLLLNFWATWCPPCVRELPLLDALHRREPAGGWRVVGLAVDSPTPVREFLRRQPVTFAVGMAGFEGVALSRSLGNESGGLPFSALFDADGRLRATHVGEFDASALERSIRQIA